MAALAFDAVTRETRIPPRAGGRDELEALQERIQYLPAVMREARRWLVWTASKVPHYVSGTPRSGKLDGPADVAALATLDEVLEVMGRDDRFAGIGFALGFDARLGSYWQGLDLDAALDKGAFTTARARDLFERSEGYAETSPSSRGFHVIGLGAEFRAVKWSREGEQAIEAYSGARFFTVTGRMMRDGEPVDLAPLVESIRADLVTRGHVRERKARESSGDAGAYLARQKPEMREWLEANPIEEALGASGFARMGERWISPNSGSGVPGVVVLDRLRAVTFHASDAGIGTPCAGDGGEVFNAFDLAARFRFSGDRRQAMRTLLPRGAAQEVTQGPQASGQGVQAIPQWREPANVFREIAAPRFEFDDVPAPIARMAKAFHEATGFDPSGVIVAAVVAAAAVIDDRYRLAVRPASEWFESARLWGVLIGGPSAGKSPTIRAASEPIKRMHAEAFAGWVAANSDKKPDEREPLPCMFTSDATVEALADLLRDNPRGMLLLTEEFASWIGAIDGYGERGGAKGRGEWLQLFDGGPHQIHRIKRGSSLVPNWGCSVLAACTPSGLRDQLRKMPDDGLIQRFIPCVMGSPVTAENGSAQDALRDWEIRLRDMFSATTRDESRAGVRISTTARMVFDAEAREIREGVDALHDLSPPLASHVGKHPGMLARVALTFHVLDARRGDAIERDTMEMAARFMRTVRRHAAALYLGVLSTSQVLDITRGLARSVVADEGRPTTVGRYYMTNRCRSFRVADDMERRLAVQTLEDAGWLAPVPGSRAYGGWAASEWMVNPQVFDAFASDGEAHRDRRAAVRDLLGGGRSNA